MISPVLAGTGQIGGVLATGKRPSANWWLAGGVSAANAVAAYQPIGAASLAASYVNLANPGTYDAAPGVAPTWASGTGWTFAGAQYLTTGILPNQSYSMVVRFSGVSSGATAGQRSSGNVYRFEIWPNITGTLRQYANGFSTQVAGAQTTAVMGVAGTSGYLNGIFDTALSGNYASPVGVAIGAINANGSILFHLTGNIQAVAIYSATLTGPQVAAISTAMAALTG